jgi:SAM-dependent methyltransferase
MATLETTQARPRPAFDLFEGFAVTNVLASLEMAGLLNELETDGLRADAAGPAAPEQAALLEATLLYLAQRGLLSEDSGTYSLTDLGRAVCRDKGYLVWLAGGYAEPLRQLGAFLRGDKRYGIDHTRDGRWVAGGAALLGRLDVVPEAMRLLEGISFDHALDLGCGNARFLTAVCQTFGCSGVGVDVSPEACEEAVKVVEAAGVRDRVQIVLGDAVDLERIPQLSGTLLVITFFLLHEISSQSRSALVRFLSGMSSALPDGAHLLTAEVVPARPSATSERFTPEFTFVHSMMRQSLLTKSAWREALQEGGFFPQEMVDLDLPGGILILAQKTTSWD